MSANTDAADSLSVSIRDLPLLHVAYVDFVPVDDDRADSDAGIRESFERARDWIRGLGYDPYAWLHVGVPHVSDRRLTSYTCCIQVAAEVQSGSPPVGIQDLPGGRYAVLSLVKEPQVIGPSIGRFYSEYLPTHGIVLDEARPTYEVYHERTMEYCVPVQ